MKFCEKCNKPLTPRPREGARFARRRFCSQKCYKARAPARYCETCGVEIDKKTGNMKYCSLACRDANAGSWKKRKPIDMPDLWFSKEDHQEILEAIWEQI